MPAFTRLRLSAKCEFDISMTSSASSRASRQSTIKGRLKKKLAMLALIVAPSEACTVGVNMTTNSPKLVRILTSEGDIFIGNRPLFLRLLGWRSLGENGENLHRGIAGAPFDIFIFAKVFDADPTANVPAMELLL